MSNSIPSDDIEDILRKMSTVNLYFTRTSLWQAWMFLINSSFRIMASMTSLIDYFTNNADYTCWIPDNVSMSDAIPINAVGKFEKCKVFENYTSLSNKTIPCPNGYIHPLPDDRSLVFTFDLYCDREYLKDIPQSAFFIGTAIGATVFSMFGDNFGKKPIALLGTWLNIICGIGCALSNTI
ncbi:hypothetical protein ACOME3_009127 [Neoechinorhynchus agilis]